MRKLIFCSRFVLVILSVCVLGCTDDILTVEEEEDIVTISIPDYDYVKRQYYFLETPGDDFQNPEYGFGMFYPVIGGVNGDSLEVFISLRPDIEWNTNTRPKYFLEAWNDPNNDGNLADGEKFVQWFYLLYEGVDYELIQDYGNDGPWPKYLGIRLRQPLGDEKALAARYRMDVGGGTIVTVGDYGNYPVIPIDPPIEPDPSMTITAELICPPDYYFLPESSPYSTYGSTWNMMFRNVYSFDSINIDPSYLHYHLARSEIRAVTASGDPAIHEYSKEKYLRIFGLDRYKVWGGWGADGFLDIRQGIILGYGHVMFPYPVPFNVSKTELLACFSEYGPPYYEIFDSMRTIVDSLSANLERNPSIYTEPIGCNPPHYYDIVVEIPVGEIE